MRNPNRLDNFYEKLKNIHKTEFPDWRFGQFIINFLSWYGQDPFYLEESKMLAKIQEFVDHLKGGN